MYITGPAVIKAVTSEEISYRDLGGSHVHTKLSGVADLEVPNEADCMKQIRRLLGFLPQNWREKPIKIQGTDDPRRGDPRLNEIVPISGLEQIKEIKNRLEIRDSLISTLKQA